MGELIHYGGGRGAGIGYFSATTPRVGPGVVLIPDVLGLTGTVIDRADRLTARERFTVLAPDLLQGTRPKTRAEGERLFEGLNPEKVAATLRDAADHLVMNWHPRLGVLDFCAGRDLGEELAHRVSADAVVVYQRAPRADRADDYNIPVLEHVGKDDADQETWAETLNFLRYHLS